MHLLDDITLRRFQYIFWKQFEHFDDTKLELQDD